MELGHPELSRRRFLAGLVASALVVPACSSDGDDTAGGGDDGDGADLELSNDPFTLGVASGDPLPTGVVLWTRLAPEPVDGGGMPDDDVVVRWEVATDEGFADVVSDGTATATPELGHSLHVDAEGLEPDTWYWYRFSAGGFESPVGRARTLPADGAPAERLRFAVASCQNWQDGYYTAYRHLAADDLDLVVFLGDYIYESGASDEGVRRHDGPAVTTLDAYRNRYALYKGDPSLQAAHARCPWLVVWDDHEVANNYAGDVPEAGSGGTEEFLRRRAEAYQAWYEHQPVRLAAPDGPDLAIHRSVAFGGLATFFLLDTRQYRSDQVCGADLDIGPRCPAVDEPGRTLLGDEQEAWLVEGLETTTATWNVLAQQVVFSPATIPVGDTEVLNLDQWDGYPAQRQRVLDAITRAGTPNPVVVTGDIHLSAVSNVPAVGIDPSSPPVGSEFVGTSISSDFPDTFIELVEGAVASNPTAHYANARQRGYLRCEVTSQQWRSEYQLVETTAEPESAIATATAWVVDAGTPGARPA